MKTLKAIDINKSYGDKPLLKNINLTINEGDKIGLIGVNGTGKSHLMGILNDISIADSGSLDHPQKYQIGYLKQDLISETNKSVLDIVFEGNSPILKAINQYEKALHELEKSPTPSNQEAFHNAELIMEKENAWNVEIEAKSILNKLGIKDIYANVNELSGGQKKRINLAQVLIQAPDLLLLDEPTNHLDYDAIEWLEKYLSSYKGALLIITHDRYFLDNVTNKIIELEQGNIHEYNGNYEAFLEKKSERLEQNKIQYQKKKQLYKQELAWMRAGVKARGTKQEARKERFYDIEKDVKNVNQKANNLEMNFEQERLGKKVIEIKDATFNFHNKQILSNFSYIVQKNERLGILGSNGSGKSTLLNLLAGIYSVDTGEIIRGETVKIGYYKQDNYDLDENKRVINYLQEIANTVTYQNQQISISELLERFLFPRSTHGTLISKLSGGEKRRLYLLSILIKQPNVLLLDEPTNDLDIETLTILEDYLNNMNGAVITVSHDRYFLDKTCSKLWILKNGNIEIFYGKASEYLKSESEKSKTTVKIKQESKLKKVEKKEKKKLTYNEQKEWENIENEMFELDEEIQVIKDEMENSTNDYVKLGELQAKLDILNNELDEKMNRYEYLAKYI